MTTIWHKVIEASSIYIFGFLFKSIPVQSILLGPTILAPQKERFSNFSIRDAIEAWASSKAILPVSEGPRYLSVLAGLGAMFMRESMD